MTDTIAVAEPNVHISQVGRDHLEDICRELEKCEERFLPLFHRQVAAWSKQGVVPMAADQWDAFIKGESFLLEGTWFDWHGPHEYFNSRWLGMWYGDPGGKDEFLRLCKSIASVLRMETRIAGCEGGTLAVRGWPDWIFSIHDWAHRHQMPMLRSQLTIWNSSAPLPSDDWGDDDLAVALAADRNWKSLDGVRYPAHPYVRSLVDNVFTASRTALRALLRPEFVAATRMPWRTHDTGYREALVDYEAASAKAHILRRTESDDWVIWLRGRIAPVMIGQQAGLHRIAELIGNDWTEYTALQLCKLGGRPVEQSEKVKQASVEAGTFENLFALDAHQPKDDLMYREKVEQRLVDLHEDRIDATSRGDDVALLRIDEEVAAINRDVNVSDDGNCVTQQRAFPKTQIIKAKKMVRMSILRVLEEIEVIEPAAAHELSKQLTTSEPFSFRSNPKFTPWRLE